jgi:hypothetical protein
MFLLIAAKEVPHRMAFVFLDDIRSRWFNAYASQGETARAFEMNAFAQTLQQRMVKI